MSKCAIVFGYVVLIYALFTFFYNVFAIYLPYANQGYQLYYDYENLSTHDNLSFIFYKPGIDYRKQCSNASIFTTPLELMEVQMVILINTTDDKKPPNFLPYVTVSFFWGGQIIMLLVSVLDFFMPCEKIKPPKVIPEDEYEFGRRNVSHVQEDIIEIPSQDNKCCGFFVRFLMGAFKVIFVSTTYAIPAYVISTFDFSTPCLVIHHSKASVFGIWDLIIPYVTFLVIVAFSLLECLLRCRLHKRMDYYDCCCMFEKILCSRGAFILCCCIPVVNTALITVACAMMLSAGFTTILWYKALVSHFSKAVALAIMTFVRWPLQIIHILLSPCRN